MRYLTLLMVFTALPCWAQTVVFQDDFNVGNTSSNLTAWTPTVDASGNGWTIPNTGFGDYVVTGTTNGEGHLEGNTSNLGGTPGNLAVATGTADGSVEFDYVDHGYAFNGAVFRRDTDGFLVFAYNTVSATVQLWRFDNGNYTKLFEQAASAPTNLRVDYVGDQITGYFDNVEVMQVTQTYNQTEPGIGLRTYSSACQIDNFIAKNTTPVEPSSGGLTVEVLGLDDQPAGWPWTVHATHASQPGQMSMIPPDGLMTRLPTECPGSEGSGVTSCFHEYLWFWRPDAIGDQFHFIFNEGGTRVFYRITAGTDWGNGNYITYTQDITNHPQTQPLIDARSAYVPPPTEGTDSVADSTEGVEVLRLWRTVDKGLRQSENVTIGTGGRRWWIEDLYYDASEWTKLDHGWRWQGSETGDFIHVAVNIGSNSDNMFKVTQTGEQGVVDFYDVAWWPTSSPFREYFHDYQESYGVISVTERAGTVDPATEGYTAWGDATRVKVRAWTGNRDLVDDGHWFWSTTEDDTYEVAILDRWGDWRYIDTTGPDGAAIHIYDLAVYPRDHPFYEILSLHKTGVNPQCGPGTSDPNCDGNLAGDGDTDGDGIPDSRDWDYDGDGVYDCGDSDADGVPNVFELDDDNDGIIDWVDEDPDGDGRLSQYDADDDGDCLEDVRDPDQDGDGIPDYRDGDLDGDGIPNDYDMDIDGDGIINEFDDDDDSDGFIDQNLVPALARVKGSTTSLGIMHRNYLGTASNQYR